MMAMSIFDLKAGLKTDTNLTATKQGTQSAKKDDFRNVLEHVQKLKQTETTQQTIKTTQSDTASVEEPLETSAQADEEKPTEEESQSANHAIAIIDEMSAIVKQQTTQVDLTATENVISFSLEMTETQVQTLVPQQRVAVAEFEQLLSQLHQFMNGKLQLDEQQLQALMSKLMKFLQQNADWMETNPLFKNKPVAELMVAIHQMLSDEQKPSLETLQKMISQFQKIQQVVDHKAVEAKPAVPMTEQKAQHTESKAAPTMNKVDVPQETRVEQPVTSGSQVKTVEQITVSNPLNQQTVTQQLTTTKQEQAQTFTPQQLPQELQKMVKSFRFNRANGTNEARFALNPEHLGHINVKVSVTNGTVVAQIYTDTAMAKETLDAQLLHLRAALQSSGLIVEKLEIFNNTMLSQQFHEQKRQQSSQQFNKQQKQKHVDVADLDIQDDQFAEVEGGHRVNMGARIDVTA
jgi:flagellar hook-length control protein FliK